MDGSISFQGGFVMNNVRKITVDEWKNIPAGAAVKDGFGGYQFAPIGDGVYTLYELVDKRNTHQGWKWERED